jgi:AcrR family transcriptional regulator
MRPVVAKDKIMDTAYRLFYEQGYNLTGINQIIEEADISKPSLYLHFKSKNDLLMAYLDQQYSSWFEDFGAYIADMADPADRLMAIFDYRIQRQIKTNYGGCAWNKIIAEVPKNDVQVFERTAKFKNAIKAVIKNLVKQLDRPADKLLNDDEFAEAVSLQVEGGLILTYITKTHQPLENAKEIIRKLM